MNLANILDLQAVKRPEKAGVVFGETEYPYAHLNREANRMANALIALGVQKGDRVAMWLPNCPEFITTFFGIIKIGAVVVPLNILFKAREVEYLLSNSESKVLVTMASCLDILQEVKDRLPHLETVVALGLDNDRDQIFLFSKFYSQGLPKLLNYRCRSGPHRHHFIHLRDHRIPQGGHAYPPQSFYEFGILCRRAGGQ